MKWFKEIFTARSGQMSSKRVCGVIGFFLCIGIGIYATVCELVVPGFMDTILITSAALMGVDSVTQIWKNE